MKGVSWRFVSGQGGAIYRILEITGFPLFWTHKIPWYFHDFSRVLNKFPGIFFIIFKVWFPSGFEYKYAHLLSFIWTKKWPSQLYSKLVNLPVYFNNLVNFV